MQPLTHAMKHLHKWHTYHIFASMGCIRSFGHIMASTFQDNCKILCTKISSRSSLFYLSVSIFARARPMWTEEMPNLRHDLTSEQSWAQVHHKTTVHTVRVVPLQFRPCLVVLEKIFGVSERIFELLNID